MKTKRGGARKGAGAKPIYKKRMRRVNVALTDEHIARGKKIGDNNLSAGVRRALEQCDDKSTS